jgi:hypothetical protein
MEIDEIKRKGREASAKEFSLRPSRITLASFCVSILRARLDAGFQIGIKQSMKQMFPCFSTH